MSQRPIALPTTLTHKALAWRRWLMILVVATLLSGGLWWAQETGRLDSLLASSTTSNAKLNTTTPSATLSTEQQPTGFVPANNNTAAALQSPAAGNDATAHTPERATQAVDTTTPTTETVADTDAVEVATAPRTLVAVAGIEGVQLWNAEGQLLTTLDIGAKLQATARTADGQWLIINADNVSGWAQAAQVVAFDLTDLPVTTLAAPVPTANSTTVAVTQPTVGTEAQTLIATTTSATAAQPVSAAITAVVTTNGANLNVRSGPSTSDGLVTKIANGATVTVLGRDESGTWLQIQLSTTTADTGWVATPYLQLDSALGTLPVAPAVAD